MAKSAIYPIIFGTMFIALGMMPRLITALMEELEDFCTLFTQSAASCHRTFPALLTFG